MESKIIDTFKASFLNLDALADGGYFLPYQLPYLMSHAYILFVVLVAMTVLYLCVACSSCM